MKITINTEVLKRENFTLNDFLVMLMGYYDYDYRETLDMLISKGIVNTIKFTAVKEQEYLNCAIFFI